jgi:hypothetical protein
MGRTTIYNELPLEEALIILPSFFSLFFMAQGLAQHDHLFSLRFFRKQA